MKLQELLLHLLSTPTLPLPQREILHITERSDNADESSLFVCIRGFRSDGHAYAADAYRRGCRAFLSEKPLALPPDAATVQVPDTRKALGELACAFYGNPSHRLRLIGVTGTKGKTTTACLIAHILEQCGIPCGYIGTNGISYGKINRPTGNTTPDALTLQKTLAEMADAGYQAAILEVSSQALRLHRVTGTRFDTCLFTNLSPDHIGPGEHPDFADYIACKHRLFTDFGAHTVVYNADDTYAQEMLRNCSANRLISCSMCGNADYTAQNIRSIHSQNRMGLDFTLRTARSTAFCELSLAGAGNVSNALLAIACAEACFGVPPSRAAEALKTAKIAGRYEILQLPGQITAVIDYAHNGVSLRQLLTTLREYTQNRLICLFGSVGGRTKQRRLELGRAAAELADICILTSDNPGEEPPEQIISEIAKAFQGSRTPYFCIPDRAEAIGHAVRMAHPGDILVLAGKGHEAYQLIGTEKRPFSEKEILLASVALLQG